MNGNTTNEMKKSTTDKKPTCKVRVIVNPTATQSVQVTYDLSRDTTQINVKFICTKAENLHSLVTRWAAEWNGDRCGYRVTFDWRGTPELVKCDQHFKTNVYLIFGYNSPQKNVVPQTPNNTPETQSPILEIKNVSSKIMNLTETVQKYKNSCGNAPDFSKRTPKNENKIINYIRSVLAMPNLPISDAMEIADSIL